ncbi:hypothetical protein ACT29I_22655 [Saccharicrinis sp. GN24d3]
MRSSQFTRNLSFNQSATLSSDSRRYAVLFQRMNTVGVPAF